MNNNIDAHILRLIEEIDKYDEHIRSHKQGSMAETDNSRKRSADMAKIYEEAVERKMRLLAILSKVKDVDTLAELNTKIFKS